VGDVRRRERPRLELVEHLAADQGRVLVEDRGAAARGDEPGIAPTAEHREGHAPDVARWRRRGGVEVAVGIEPGDGQAQIRPAPLQRGHRRRMRGAVAAEEQERRIRVGAALRPEGRLDAAGQPGEVLDDPIAVLRQGIRILDPAGIVRRIAVIHERGPGESGP
jgi:hypothetical protein